MLKFDVKTTNIELTPDVSDYLTDKVTDIEKLIDPNDTSAEAQVEIGKTTKGQRTGDIFRAEINLHIAGKNLRVVAKQGDIFAAIDVMKDDIVRRLRRHKDKRIGYIRRGGSRVKKMLRRLYRREGE